MRRQQRWLPAVLLWLVSLLTGMARAESSAATVQTVTGTVTVQRKGMPASGALRVGDALYAGDIVRTGADGKARLLFNDGSETRLNLDSAIEILTPGPAGRGRRSLFRALSGELWARLRPGKGIEAYSAFAVVYGTELDLKIDADKTALLTVLEGEVSFSNPRGTVVVGESQQSTARPDTTPTAPVTIPNAGLLTEWTLELDRVVLPREKFFITPNRQELESETRQRSERVHTRPGDPDARRAYGDVLFDTGKFAAALDEYQEANRLAPGEPAMLTRLGDTLLAMGRVDEAESSYHAAAAYTPARVGLAWSALIRNRPTDAQKIAEQALAAGTTTVKTQAASRQSEAAPGNMVEARIALGLSLMRQPGRLSEAIEILQAALGDEPAAYRYQAQAWLALAHMARDDTAAALREAQEAIRLAPQSALAHGNLALVYFYSGKAREAGREARLATQLNPDSVAARVVLGQALLAAGNVDRAVETAAYAVALDPRLPQTHYLLGIADAQRRDDRHAERELKESLRLAPEFTPAASALARVYTRTGRRREAVMLLTDLLPRHRQSGTVLAALGQVYYEQGRFQEAAAQYREAIRLQPNSALYHGELGRVYLEQNKLPDALTHGLAAVGAAPTSSEAYTLLGLIYDRMSNPEQALRAYREALARSPENGLARFGLGLALINPNPGAGLVESAQAAQQGAFRDGQREVAQAALRDPSLPSLLFKPGVTTELTPGAGSDAHRSFGFTHRDQFARGTLHDLSFGSQDWLKNYRNGRPEKGTLRVASLTALPSYRTHVLGTYFYSGREIAYPGSTFSPDADDREQDRTSYWALSTRLRVHPATFVWLQAARAVFHFDRQNPDSPADGNLTAFGRGRRAQLYLEGRLDHGWGHGHTTTYVLSAAREQSDSRFRLFNRLQGAFDDVDVVSRPRRVTQTLQHDYHSGSRLALILGLTTDRFTRQTRAELANLGTRRLPEEAETSWLPFGEATFALTRRDLIRAIAHKRRNLTFDFTLQPADAFLLGESPSPNVEVRTTNYELDCEHRFSRRRFAKLFLFRSDVDGLRVDPAVFQEPGFRAIGELTGTELVGFRVPKARIEGIGLRYEHQIGRFLSSYLRFTYSEATDRTALSTRGRQVPLNPRSRAVLGLNYVDRAGTKLFAQLDWRGEMLVDPNWSDSAGFDPLAPRPRFPAKLVVNLRFAKERTVRREWVLRINNLFDTNTIYWPGFPAPGRTFQLQYSVRF